MISGCRTDKFNRSRPHVACRMWKSLPTDLFSGGTLSSFKSAINLCLQMAQPDFPLFISVPFCCSIACLASLLWGRSGLLGVTLFRVICAR